MPQVRPRSWILLLLLWSFVLPGSDLAAGTVADAEPMTPPDMPTGVQASDGTYDTHIRVTWNIVSGATHYYVSRGTGPTWTGSGAAWADTAPPFDNRYDQTMPPAPYVTYYYWVQACNGQDCSAMAGPDSGWRPDIAPTATSTHTATRTPTRTPTRTRTRTRTPTRASARKVFLPIIMK
jgi:hypothetical protein